MQRLLAAQMVLAVLLAPIPTGAAGFAGTVCVVGEASDGLEAETVRTALLVERRKRASDVTVQLVAEVERCTPARDGAPTVRVILGPGARAAVVDPGRPSVVLELAEAAASERAPEVARAAIDAVPRAPLAEAGRPLVDVSAAVPLPLPPYRPLEQPLAGLVTVAGGYDYGFVPGGHRGWIGAEAALVLFEGRLGVGVAGAWAPGRDVPRDDLEARLTSGELLAVARGGLAVGPVLLRLGVGVGYEWRRLTVRSSLRFEAVEARSGATVLALEPEALLPIADRYVVGLAVPTRVYFGGEDHEWQGETLSRAPRAAIGVTVRGGVAF